MPKNYPTNGRRRALSVFKILQVQKRGLVKEGDRWPPKTTDRLLHDTKSLGKVQFQRLAKKGDRRRPKTPPTAREYHNTFFFSKSQHLFFSKSQHLFFSKSQHLFFSKSQHLFFSKSQHLFFSKSKNGFWATHATAAHKRPAASLCTLLRFSRGSMTCVLLHMLIIL